MEQVMEEGSSESHENTQLQSFTFASLEQQKARSFLRERFLQFVTAIVGKNMELNLCENSTISGEFRGCDVECLNIYIRNLQTPLGKIPEAILRSSDIVSFVIEGIKDNESVLQFRYN